MIMRVYSVKDELTGYMPPLTIVNEQAALRWFNNNYRREHPNANDFHLYDVGSFDTESGTVIGQEPTLIAEEE